MEMASYRKRTDGEIASNGQDNPGFQNEDVYINDPVTKTNGGMNHQNITDESEDDMLDDGNACSRGMTNFRQSLIKFYRENRKQIVIAIKFVLCLLYFAYFGYALYYRFGDEGSIRLLVCTVLACVLIARNIITDVYHDQLHTVWIRHCKPTVTSDKCRNAGRYFGWILLVAVFFGVSGYIIYDVAIDHPQNLMSVAGLVLYIIVFYIFSKNPAKVNWRPVLWGIAIQYIFALLILRTYWGYKAFKWLGDRVTEFLAYTSEGASFVFGKAYLDQDFAFSVLPVVVFFYTMISVLYYLGVMQVVIRYIGQFLAFCLGTTPAESLNAAGNIFIGMTEAPLMIQPFLKDMTKSELHAVMTGGFATIAGTVLGAYISFGVPANHLLSASVMSAPAALAVSKLIYPETEVPKTNSKDFQRMGKSTERNVIEAMSNGASKSVAVVASIAVNIIAFLCVLKFVNETLTWFGDRVGVEGLTFQLICSYVFFPIAYFMGVETDDCRQVAELIGVKTFTNEFIAYKDLSILIDNKKNFTAYTSTSWNDSSADWYYSGSDIILPFVNQTLVNGILSDKSEVIATYALCGFSNFGSMGMFLGGMTALAPTRKTDLSKIVVSAMIAGNVACFLTGCVAGLLYKDYGKL